MSAAARMAAVLTAMIGGCATLDADGPKRVTGHALAPHGMHEECAKLAPGDRLEYTFTSDEPVDFNIHYHDGAAVVEPITRNRVPEDAGVFAPALAQDYCLTWEAGAAGATLDYRLRIRRTAK
jgi:hypothetical protein